MNELISVIVPVYNTGLYLSDCIESIVSQDYLYTEIIIVDDGSTDDFTLKKCDEISKKYGQVSLYHKPNGGSASARNYGVQVAKGKYVGFVDSDDTIDKEMYSTLYSLIKKDNVTIAICGLATFFMNKRDIHYNDNSLETRCYEDVELMHNFLLGHWHSACTNLYLRELFEDIKFPENEVNEDYMLNYWMFKSQQKISFINQPFYHYIRRENSNTSSPKTLRFLDWIKHTELVLTEMSQDDRLKMEAEYQYLHSNIVLGNSSLLTLRKIKSTEAEQLYEITCNNLAKSKKMLRNNKYLSFKYLIMGIMMSECHTLYKQSILGFSKIIKLICKKD
ncbi:MAG: glycosyltransferase family 2 protein [Prevotella sp.]|nr:glycosyltransferase family 2 protein [Prevotella sp.]